MFQILMCLLLELLFSRILDTYSEMWVKEMVCRQWYCVNFNEILMLDERAAANGLFTLHGNRNGKGTGNGIGTIGDNGTGSIPGPGAVWTVLYKICLYWSLIGFKKRFWCQSFTDWLKRNDMKTSLSICLNRKGSFGHNGDLQTILIRPN